MVGTLQQTAAVFQSVTHSPSSQFRTAQWVYNVLQSRIRLITRYVARWLTRHAHFLQLLRLPS